MPKRSPILAAGGVVWRPGSGEPEIALVHRPRYDDWSLPKGKADDGETELAAAVREIDEEIGATVAVQRRLTTVKYKIDDTPKLVTYWAMRHLGGAFSPNHEVDRLQWLTPKAARKQLSYQLDRAVLDAFTDAPPPDSVVVLVRHAKAGKRTQWDGDDALRPLEPAGVRQAEDLVPFLGAFAPVRVVSAEPRRCIQTVTPFADAAGLPVQVDPAFGDEAYVSRPGAMATALLALAKPGAVTVVSSQGTAIPGVLEELLPSLNDTDTKKGASWVLCFVDGELSTADHYPAP